MIISTPCPDCGAELKSGVDNFNRPYQYCGNLCGYKTVLSKGVAQPVKPIDLLPLKSTCNVGCVNDCLHNPNYLKQMIKNRKKNSFKSAKVWDTSMPKPNG